MIKLLVSIAFVLAGTGLAHQYKYTGIWFSWKQLIDAELNHEDLIVLCLVAGVAGVALLIGRYLRR